MIDETILRVKQDMNLYTYLKYHSYWYKILKRDKTKLKDMVYEMKKELKIRSEDKLSDLTNKIQMVSSLLEVLK